MKKRILHVLNTGSYSGAENVVITIINSTKDHFVSAYTSPGGLITDVLNENNIAHYPVKSKRMSVHELKRVIHEFQPDIIHAHDFTTGVICSLVCGRIPIISHLHNNPIWAKHICFKSIIYFLATCRMQKILTVSSSIMEEYIFGKYLKKKTSVVGNPLSIDLIRRKANESSLKNESDIMYLGRFSSEKNPLLFLDIVYAVIRENIDIHISMVGSGELCGAVEARIKELGISDNITLYGFQQNPYGLLSSTKIVIMPSVWEGFGLVAVESMALGKPVLASPVGGLANIVTNECGALCISKEDYINEIEKLLTNEAYYLTKHENALKRCLSFDNIPTYSCEITDCYNSIIT